MKKINLILSMIAVIAGCQNLLAMNDSKDSPVFVIEEEHGKCQILGKFKRTQRPDVLYYPNNGKNVKPGKLNKGIVFDFGDYKGFYGNFPNVTSETFPSKDLKYIQIHSSNVATRSFSGMKSLEVVEINSDQPITIDDYAFFGCPNLKKVVINGQIEYFASNALNQTDVEVFLMPVHRFKIFSKPNEETYNFAKTLTIFPFNVEWHYINYTGQYVSIDMFQLDQMLE